MNKKLIFSVLLVVCLLAVVTVIAFAQNSPNVRWDYTIYRQSGSWAESELQAVKQLGEQGWELVTSHSNGLLFKRRLP